MEDLRQASSKTLAPMRSHQEEALVSRDSRPQARIALQDSFSRLFAAPLQNQQERVDDRVSRPQYPFFRYSFRFQVGNCLRRGRKMVRRQMINEAPIHLVGKWSVALVRPQAGFHVTNGNLLVKGCQRCDQRRGGIAMHEDKVGGFATKEVGESSEHSRG